MILYSEFKIQTKNFDQLQLVELYKILELRSSIFVVEQNCVYQDVDGKDQKALHIVGKIKGEIIAYARCFPPDYYFKEAAIGRVLVEEHHRKSGYAHQLIKSAISAIKYNYQTTTIKISGQQHLKPFYEAHNFQVVGDGYLEDGIPHYAMIRKE